MPWHVITKEGPGIEGRLSAIGMEHRAISFACDLIAAGVTVLRIEGDHEVISAEEVAERCAGRKVLRPTRQ